MEGLKRTAFQGVYNIVRFNWQFYVIAFVTLAGAIFRQTISTFFTQFTDKYFYYFKVL